VLGARGLQPWQQARVLRLHPRRVLARGGQRGLAIIELSLKRTHARGSLFQRRLRGV
jgi:hypothetical protein